MVRPGVQGCPQACVETGGSKVVHKLVVRPGVQGCPQACGETGGSKVVHKLVVRPGVQRLSTSLW